MQIQPLGDQAAMAYCTDEQAALILAARVRRQRFPWLVDVVQAYTSVAVYYDLGQVDFGRVAGDLEQLPDASAVAPQDGADNLHIIPCCYELGLDLERIGQATGLTTEEIIRLHTCEEYTVYAIGFCPGFPYLGYLPEKLCGVPRLPSPRLRVEPGSVGLTGRQTGIYTEPRPGGWNIVGRTPLKLVDVAQGYFPLRTGDRVRFEKIGVQEYRLAGSQQATARAANTGAIHA